MARVSNRWFRAVLICVFSIVPIAAYSQTTSFVFEGDVGDPGIHANFDMQFRLYDSASGDVQVGSMVFVPVVSVSGGKFTVTLNFGAPPFSGADRWVEIRTSPAGTGSYTIVAPRERVLSVPYAVRSLVATSSDQLGGTDASEFVQTADPRLSDARVPISGSGNYIQNSTSTQPSANFNIAGNGTAARINATAQYDLLGVRILDAQGDNLFVGWSSGFSNTTGHRNTAVGSMALRSTTTGANNTVYGVSAGYSNVTGHENSLFGQSAGFATTASFNSFFGGGAGRNNTTGERSAFMGRDSGYRNTTGSRNAFYGATSGNENTTGNDNTFVGHGAGYSNTTGSNNTALGANANVATGLSYATAIGSSAYVSNSNSVVLGRGADTVRVPGRLQLNTLSAAGGVSLCRNASNEIAMCSSSIRYKSNVMPYQSGLTIVNRLAPVTFDWKGDGSHDFGLVAEDVNKVEPLLSNYNANGEVEGVKYDRVAIVLINAVKEQQQQIDAQQKLIADQRLMIEQLRKLVCARSPRAEACR